MVVQRTVADPDERREVELLLARCDVAEGLELPVVVPPVGELPEGGIAPFLWVEDGRTVGFLVLEGWPIPEGTPLVQPDCRLRGIGRALAAAATGECRQSGLRRWLMVGDSAREGASRFAQRIGARYDSSEYRMDLDRSALPNRPEGDGDLQLVQTDEGRIEEFARTLAEAFDDPLDQVRRWTAEQAHLANVRLFVVRWQDTPVGTLRLITVGFHAYLTAVGVLAGCRRQGIGRFIVLTAVHGLLDEGWEHIRIKVDTANEPAHRLYRACGFRETRTYRFYELLTGR